MSEYRQQRAHDLALSCRRCGHPTDAQLNAKTSKWMTWCECGKTGSHLKSDIDKEVEELLKTIPNKRK